MDKENLKDELIKYSTTFTNSSITCEGVTLPLIKNVIDNFDDTPTAEQAWEKIAEDKGYTAAQAKNIFSLHKSEKPEIPKFVADWIEEVKQRGCGLADALNCFESPIMPEKVKQWIQFDFAAIGCHHDNQELLAKAWLNGYAIEKEPVWVVRINGKLYFCSFTDKYFEKDSDAPTYIESGNPSLIKKFTNKDKAEAVAILVDGEVEEWSG